MKLPKTIYTKIGKRIVFKEIKNVDGVDILYMDCYYIPGAGPDMYVHYLQEETLKVVKGLRAYQIKGREIKYLKAGESATFGKVCHHKFYNASEEEMHVEAIINPALNTVDFCTGVNEALDKGKNGKPEPFNAAYLFLKYRKEHGASDVN